MPIEIHKPCYFNFLFNFDHLFCIFSRVEKRINLWRIQLLQYLIYLNPFPFFSLLLFSFVSDNMPLFPSYGPGYYGKVKEKLKLIFYLF